MNGFSPTAMPEYLHNRGCGISYLQRNRKIPFSLLDPDVWFLREKLCDKIAIDVPWSVIEPEEGRYEWSHPEWEGCFQSWIDAGFKVHLKVRGMDTLGTLYDEGTPQWVFDAGAKFIDDPISIYRREKILLNMVPEKGHLPVRYPVYWDPVYIEKSEQMIYELGKRYNGHPAVESVSISQVGRWGEMHLGDWGPMEPWFDAGFSYSVYNQTMIRFIDMYLKAFRDTQLSLSICPVFFYSGFNGLEPLMEIFDYAAEHGVMIKYDGLGHSSDPANPYLGEDVSDIFRKYSYKTKVFLENLVLPEALDTGIAHKISYWHRGGEFGGLRILKLDEDCSVFDKRIFSWYKAYPSRYDEMTKEQQKDCFRKMARKCGYRLRLDSLFLPENLTPGRSFPVRFHWRNDGYAPCYEKFHVELSLFDKGKDCYIWQQETAQENSGNPIIWDVNKTVDSEQYFTLPSDFVPGQYELRLGIRFDKYNQEMMQLALNQRMKDGRYVIGIL